jgi:excisionase family DNA binding protein
MIRRKEDEKILDMDASMEGSLVFSDPVNLRINGNFKGTLNAKGNLIIGENARVSADIVGESIIISGRVIGKIKATKSLKLTSTAEVEAEIETVSLSIEEGAILNGKINMLHNNMSLREVSEFLSIEESKILEWVNAGRMPAKREGENLFFDRKELEEWLNKNL